MLPDPDSKEKSEEGTSCYSASNSCGKMPRVTVNLATVISVTRRNFKAKISIARSDNQNPTQRKKCGK